MCYNRSTALNFASACARLGAIVAPGIAMTGIFHSTLPYTSFGLISLIAGKFEGKPNILLRFNCTIYIFVCINLCESRQRVHNLKFL